MKFWKQILLSAMLLTSIISTAVFTSCEKNACDGVTCLNGGACGHGLCNCPTGYEGARCETKAVQRYLGTYSGYTTCNSGAPTIDTVTVVPANRGILSVDVYYKSLYEGPDKKILRGYVSSNESTYAIIVTNDDSSKSGSKVYSRVFTITVQSDKSLKLHTFEHNETVAMDTFDNKCEFLGTKTKLL